MKTGSGAGEGTESRDPGVGTLRRGGEADGRGEEKVGDRAPDDLREGGTGTGGTPGAPAGIPWRGWIVSIVVAVLLSAVVTCFLGRFFHSRHCAPMAGGNRTGCGMACCGPAEEQGGEGAH